jgi:hypothetical protein
MTRLQLEHIIRAAASLADDQEIVVVGSQSILGAHPNAPAALLVSMEADVYPKNHPERSDLVDGSIGELSPFHDTFGYYARGVGPETSILPLGWENRPAYRSSTCCIRAMYAASSFPMHPIFFCHGLMAFSSRRQRIVPSPHPPHADSALLRRTERVGSWLVAWHSLCCIWLHPWRNP